MALRLSMSIPDRELRQIVHTVIMPNKGDEFHHFGWNACSSALSPLTGHAFLERRYLDHSGDPLVPNLCGRHQAGADPGQRSTKSSSPRRSSARPVIPGRTRSIAGRKAYTFQPWAVADRRTDGPPGIFIMDCETFECAAARRSTAACRTNTTISGGTCRATIWSQANGRCRRSSKRHRARGSAVQQIWASGSTSGTCAPAATYRLSTSVQITRWLSRCGQPMIP